MKAVTMAFAAALLVGTSVSAQTTARRLHFELYRNDQLVGTPEVTVNDGAQGSLSIPNFVNVAFTPRSAANGDVRLALTVTYEGHTIRPEVTLPAQLKWKPSSDSVELKVSLVP